MGITELLVQSKEQTIFLQNGNSVMIRFDMIYKRWFFDLYGPNGLVYAGIALNVDTIPLLGITNISPGLADLSASKEEYEPYSELGGRLALLEVSE